MPPDFFSGLFSLRDLNLVETNPHRLKPAPPEFADM
jgi:hypothetical protein